MDSSAPLARATKVLFVSRSLATPNFHGGCTYARAVVDYLGTHDCDISYLWLAEPLSAGRLAMRQPSCGPGVRHFYAIGAVSIGGMLVSNRLGDIMGAPLHALRRRFKGVGLGSNGSSKVPTPSATDFSVSPVEGAAVRQMVRKLRPDAVLVDCTETSPILREIPAAETGSLKVLLTVNVLHQRAASYRQRGLAFDFPPLTREQETAALEQADVLVAIQVSEAEELKSMLPAKTTIVAPMPAVLKPLPNEHEVAGQCLFIGGSSQHNVDGLNWFLREVWPLILNEVPEATLDVCGGVGAHVQGSHPRCHIRGLVDNLEDAYARAAVCLVPLRAGSGLKIKLVEAMSFGRAVVTTEVGAEGLPAGGEGGAVTISNSAADFARRTTELLKDQAERQRTVRRQTEWLQTALSPDATFGELLAALRGHVGKMIAATAP